MLERILALDLHTGHGAGGQVTFLSDWLCRRALRTVSCGDTLWGDAEVEATVGNPDATTGLKFGQIANGLRAARARCNACFSSAVEFGTVSDTEQLAATCQEQWVHRRGDRTKQRR